LDIYYGWIIVAIALVSMGFWLGIRTHKGGHPKTTYQPMIKNIFTLKHGPKLEKTIAYHAKFKDIK